MPKFNVSEEAKKYMKEGNTYRNNKGKFQSIFELLESGDMPLEKGDEAGISLFFESYNGFYDRGVLSSDYMCDAMVFANSSDKTKGMEHTLMLAHYMEFVCDNMCKDIGTRYGFLREE